MNCDHFMYDFLSAKRAGQEHSEEEICTFISMMMKGDIPDYQISAWLMAVCINGMTFNEVVHLTLAMRDSGRTLNLDSIPGIKLDKHSTGGVGDKTTLIIIPILAAAGVPILKMSGRGLGFTGGTTDKLGSIPGFRTALSIQEAVRQVLKWGAAMVSQVTELAPADKRLYALRDVTATVDSIPLITSSILSKKLAVGADVILFDVKIGSGAFMRSLDEGKELGRMLIRVSKAAGKDSVALLTNMDQPLGRAVGNALEVREACELLTNPHCSDTRLLELCRELVVNGLVLADKVKSVDEGREEFDRILNSGDGARSLERIVSAQGGDPSIVAHPELLPSTDSIIEVRAECSGYVTQIHAGECGRIAMALGAGRSKLEDDVNPAAGISLNCHIGDYVERNQVLALLHDPMDLMNDEMLTRLRSVIVINAETTAPMPLLYGELTSLNSTEGECIP